MINSATQYRYVDCHNWHCSGNIYPLRSGASQYNIVGEDVLFLHECLGERIELLTSTKQQFDLNSYTWQVQPGQMAINGSDLINVADNIQGTWVHVNQGGYFLKEDYDLSSNFIQTYYNDFNGTIWNTYDQIMNIAAKQTFIADRNAYYSWQPLTRQGLDNLYQDMRNTTKALRYGGNMFYLPDKYTSQDDPDRPGWYGRVASTYEYNNAYYEPQAQILPSYHDTGLDRDEIWKIICQGGYGGTIQIPDRTSGYYQQWTRDGAFLYKGRLPSILTDYSVTFLVRYEVWTSDFEKMFIKELQEGDDLVDAILPMLSQWGVHDDVTWEPQDGQTYAAIVYATVNPIFHIGNHTRWW